MNTIKDIVKNEVPQDVILFLATDQGISHPQLDRLYSSSDWPFLSDNTSLILLINHMISEGLISFSGKAYVKGPHWREPQFLTEKKYKLAP
ncbi:MULTISPECIES: hypothetical protein [Pseudomonas]|uniref:Uncharacterized protein n=1 Tax=Pseudomonas soli TaxID=1306993 RepID=A0A2V4ICS3_9PSED|nr:MULTISPECIES: hypothetical protein [Pseudomonas]PYB75876.1 hypothetical protein DMX07_22985 [Pseudomonas soli]QWA30627.1 hypothetical protein KHO27_07045 [Pseudomonas sp. RC3H12]UVM14716.1 hypothetical protein LOY42_15580 [Pseudomonas sp. B21-023]